MSIKGFPTQQKLLSNSNSHAQFVTTQPMDQGLRYGLDTVAKFVFRVDDDITARTAGANTGNPSDGSGTIVYDTSTPAKVGDMVRFEDGKAKYLEIPIAEVSTNFFKLAARLPANSVPESGDTFFILRYGTQRMDESCSQSVTVQGSPIRFVKDGLDVEVEADTGTPANSVPLPVQLYGLAGDINVTAGDLNVQLNHTGNNYDSTRIGDGTNLLGITANNEALVSDATAQASLANLEAVDFATYTEQGAQTALLTSLDGKDFATNTEQVAQTVLLTSLDGKDFATYTEQTAQTVLLTSLDGKDFATETEQIAQTVLLTSLDGKDFATSAKQDTGNTSLSNIDAKFGSLGQKNMAGSAPVVIASDQSAIPASQSGTWNITNISGTVSLPTGAATEAKQDTGNSSLSSIDTKLSSVATAANQTTANTSLSNIDTKLGGTLVVIQAGRTCVARARIDYSSSTVSTSAYTQLISSVGGTAVREVEIFDSSGQTLFLATGGAGSEADQVYILPGGNGRIPLAIAASTRVAVKAVSASATSGELTVNFYS